MNYKINQVSNDKMINVSINKLMTINVLYNLFNFFSSEISLTKYMYSHTWIDVKYSTCKLTLPITKQWSVTPIAHMSVAWKWNNEDFNECKEK